MVTLKKLTATKSHINSWFLEYTKKYRADSEIHGKIQHTMRVKALCHKIGIMQKLDTNQLHLLDIIATLHDIGRFKQYQQYNTQDDSQSTDHAFLSITICDQDSLLNNLPKNTQWYIKEIIYYHNKIEIQSPIKEDPLFVLLTEVDRYDILKQRTPASHSLKQIDFVRDEILLALAAKKFVNIYSLLTHYEYLISKLIWIITFTSEYLHDEIFQLTKEILHELKDCNCYRDIIIILQQTYPSLKIDKTQD